MKCDKLYQISWDMICILDKLMLVMPATNAVSERSFPVLNRVKPHLRSTSVEAKLNHLMFLHVHKELTDAMDMHVGGHQFVMGDKQRLQLKFSKNDLPMKSVFVYKAPRTV